jgi:signal transduction histidine kinase/putative methionine-R-sulfoxide reductase with GAF domain
MIFFGDFYYPHGLLFPIDVNMIRFGMIETMDESIKERYIQNNRGNFRDSLNDPDSLLDLLKMIIQWVTELISADAAEIFLWDPSQKKLVLSVSNGFLEKYVGTRLDPGEGISGRAFQTNKPLLIKNYSNWEGKPAAFAIHPEHMDVLAVPMHWRDQTIGVLVVDTDNRKKKPTENDLKIVKLFANVGSVAIQNERLYRELEERSNRMTETLEQKVEERTTEIAHRALQLETSASISRDITSILDIDKLLNRIVNVIRKSFDFDYVSIFFYDAAEKFFTMKASSTRKSFIKLKSDHLSLKGMMVPCQEAVTTHKIQLLEDGQSQKTVNNKSFSLPGWSLIIPLRHGNRIIGTLNFWNHVPILMRDSDKMMFQSLGDQIAVAIQNAMLYRYQQEIAIIEERNRIARNLHDAVSQTLFSAMMIAESLPEIYESQPDEGKNLLEDLHQLNRSALTEMRALLLELRPETMQNIGLNMLLAQLLDAVSKRTGITIKADLQEVDRIPQDVKQSYYRIAQEAISNVTKHSEATKLEVALYLSDQKGLVMVIEDNGKGFDPNLVLTESLGINIMRERANICGAQFELHSKMGFGTKIVLCCKKLTPANIQKSMNRHG